MNKLKWFLSGFLIAFICNLSIVAHAEEVDPYFAWDIKNFDNYQPYNLLFQAQNRKNITAIRDEIYWAVINGKYSDAVFFCEMSEAEQKIAFGTDYFDGNLEELTAKLYLATDEYDKAERKINSLLTNAQDNPSKIRALNLKSDLCNFRGNYFEALKITDEVHDLLLLTPDEALSLINRARAAAALCGLNETKASLEFAEEILPSMQVTFGSAGIETLALMSTLAEDYRKVQRYEESAKILSDKMNITGTRYGQNDSVITAKTFLELAEFYFEINEPDRCKNLLDSVLHHAAKCADSNNYRASLQLYTTLNEIAHKNLNSDNHIVLLSELGLARTRNAIGDIPQSIELCRKNLSKFKKVFGEKSYEAVEMMKLLSDNYFLLGKYSDAKKILDETLTICEKNFGEHDWHTVAAKIDLANVYYKTGRYKSADKLIAEIETNNRDLFKLNQPLYYDFLLSKVTGARMKTANIDANRLLNQMDEARGKLNPQAFNVDRLINSYLERKLDIKAIADFDNLSDGDMAVLNMVRTFLSDCHPKVLDLLIEISESYMLSGNLKDAEKFTEQVFNVSRKHFGENNFYEWKAFNMLSKIRRAEGNFSDALAIDTQALKIAEKVCGKNSLERLQSLDSIASDYAAAGNFSEAIKIREKTLSEYKKILEDVDETTIRMMTNLAENYIAAKRYSDAVKLCDETLAKQKNPVFTSEEISPNKNVVELFRIKATAQKLLGDNVNAYENYRRLIQTYEFKRRTAFAEGIFSTNENKSRWFADIVPVYKDAAAVAVTEEIADDNFAFYCAEFCKGRSLIDRYDDILVSKNYLITSFERASLNNYEKFLNSCRTIMESNVAEDDATLSSNIGTIYTMLTVDSEIFKRELRQKYSNRMVPKDLEKRAEAEQKPSPWEESLKSFDVNKNRQAIPDGACFVEFMKISDEELLAVFLRNDSDVGAENISVDKNFFDRCRLYHELNSYADINALHSDGKYLWRTGDGKYIIAAGRTAPVAGAVAINDSAKWSELRKELSAELSQKLIPTIETYAGGCAHWIISPDAELNLLPFETLNYRDKMLIESVDVSYVPSLAVLNLMKKRERKNHYLGQSKEFFAMGDAVYGNSDAATSRGSQLDFFNTLRSKSDDKIDITALKWSNLPGTARELDKVSPLFESKDIFRRGQVTEKNLRSLNISGELSKYKYLLFATHGLFVPDMPEISSIVLSQEFNDADTDGYVTVGEWMGYDLRSNLVYL
ncbi:MAG: tetratricopeptide repeat protein [Quinella sp. 3Q1]|nr:tetratricopeptide repeat protein [Quinella sp. 3Q1]